ncbi:kinase-like protein [Calocera viscosa TUFC12733]|uniref:Kinase-like protein n=1 Tax=Calocera viscosa (strain TUFC12733) TaxID=1330018 RepID=A0A167HP65_CALVF|nr:kinase-like protein [Calocera viscosa TUFC12733]
MLPFGLVIKGTTLREAEALQSLNRANIPLVPRLIDCVSIPYSWQPFFNCGNYAHEEMVIIIMTRLEGQPIAHRLATFTGLQTKELGDALRTSFSKIRELQPPNNQVCGFGGRCCVSYHISFDVFGPFPLVKMFNRWMNERTRYRVKSDDELPPPRNDTEKLAFSHGDLMPHNILVSKEGKLTGLIDWECAGWMPRHWDAAYALFMYDSYKPWEGIINQVFAEDAEDVRLEREWYLYWGE